MDENPFAWKIVSPEAVVYTHSEAETIKEAVNVFRRSLPHHSLLALNLLVINDDGTFGSRHTPFTQGFTEEGT